MSKQYCFDIQNPNNVEFDSNALKKFVENLYKGRNKDQFKKNEKLPFVTIYVREDNSVCVLMTSKGKKNIERIEAVNRKLKLRDLQWENGIFLSEPYNFDVVIDDWWGGTKPKLKGKRWTSLRQRGPYFTNLMEPYEPLGASLTYEGKKYPLTPEEEKIASFYAKRKNSEAAGKFVVEWTKDSVFNKNFWNDFKKYLTPAHKSIFRDFTKIGWGDLIAKIEADKAVDLTSVEKVAKKIRTEEKKRVYGYAWLDGKREKVGNFTIEPQAIFYGRGENPNRGRVKAEINPEDVTINVGESDPVPDPPAGHNWGDVVHDHTAVWLAKWNDSITGDTKYVMFSAESRFKGESDLVKYEKARKLEMHIDTVRERYMVDAASKNTIKMQLGTVLYLIDHFGVRVGNEQKEDGADTVGASTLRVGHVKLKTPDHVIFDFLGKDSIRFYKDLKVPLLIYDNFAKLLGGKKKTEQVFDSISSRSINAYLKEFDKSFSAKVFRTRLASKIMFDALKNVKIPKRATKARTKVLFNKANAKVAKVLNHTRNVSKKAQDDVKEKKQELADVEKKLKAAKKAGKSTKSLEKKKATLKTHIEAKTDVMTVAINTSLANYIDPRMIVAWSKLQGSELTAVYTSALMRKFQWAIKTTDKDWKWGESPLIGNPKLEPLEGECTAVQISEEDKPHKRSRRRRSRKSRKPPRPVPTHPPPKLPTPPPLHPVKPLYIGLGTVADYELLLRICEDPEKYKYKFFEVSKDAMEWIVHFSRYAINKGIQVKANDYIVQFYNAAYK
jgi:DNA topoisomerase-1